jgi:ribosome-binding protein aMBF1 (putative translation factor)
VGAKCAICTERRRERLKSIELLGAWMPVCFNCSGRASTLVPMPQTVAGIRVALDRERRSRDRRFGKKDTRVFQYDRRSADRRDGRTVGDDCLPIDDEMILDIELAEVVASLERELELADREDLTRIRELPPPLPAPMR